MLRPIAKSRRKYTAFKCDNCGADKETYMTDTRKALPHHFCSRVCFGKWRSKTFVGESSGAWKGGHKNYKGPNWQAQAEQARKRANHRCETCHVSEEELGKRLDVDHIKPFTAFNDWRRANELLNLRAFCHSCHMKSESNKPFTARFLRLF